ncbi:unnamed protein product [Caretta caretta]
MIQLPLLVCSIEGTAEEIFTIQITYMFLTVMISTGCGEAPGDGSPQDHVSQGSKGWEKTDTTYQFLEALSHGELN